MSSEQSQRPFAAGEGPPPGRLVAAASSLTASASDPSSHPTGALGTLVVVVVPHGAAPRVIGGDGNGAIRAAVAVAAAAGNHRVWDGVSGTDTVERTVASLPEVVRAAAEGAGASTVHVGAIHVGDELAAVALWFATSATIGAPAERRDVLRILSVAAEHEAQLRAAAAAETARTAVPMLPATVSDDSDALLFVGSTDPDVDRLTGLASRRRFERELAEFDADEATLLLIDLDGFTALNHAHGRQVGDAVLRETALRLAATCRRSDVVARLDADEFAVVLRDTDRSTALQTSRRLLATIAEPLPAWIGPERVTATVAMAHQIGLPDMDELFDSADEALTSGKRQGPGRIVIAA